MFTSVEAFLQIWSQEAGGTQRILDALTDASLSQAVSADDRTLGRVAWHVVASLAELMEKTGLKFEGINEDSPVPATAQEIAEQYRRVNAGVMAAIREQWNDQVLAEERNMFGQMWTIGTTLQVLVFHQIHHRGQMTVLMRQAGLKVPGIYGPAREEWQQMGRQAPAV